MRTSTTTEFPQFAWVQNLRADVKHRSTSAWYDRVLAAVRAGADVSTADRDGQNLFHLAAVFGDTHLALQLVEAGADHDARDRLGRTALMKAEALRPLGLHCHILLYLRSLANPDIPIPCRPRHHRFHIQLDTSSPRGYTSSMH